MQITHTRINVAYGLPNDHKFLAYATIILDDCFAVHDLKIIKGDEGETIVKMPTRHLKDRCPRCGKSNPFIHKYCAWCGLTLGQMRAQVGEDGKARLFVDIAHPITADFRGVVEDMVLNAYWDELEYDNKQPDISEPEPII